MVSVRFFIVGQHLAHVPLQSWPLYSRINSPSRLFFYSSLVIFDSQVFFIRSVHLGSSTIDASNALPLPVAFFRTSTGFLDAVSMVRRIAAPVTEIFHICTSSLVSLALCRLSSQGLSSVYLGATVEPVGWSGCPSMFWLDRKSFWNTTINFINVFNDLLINPLISLTNKNAFLIHFIWECNDFKGIGYFSFIYIKCRLFVLCLFLYFCASSFDLLQKCHNIVFLPHIWTSIDRWSVTNS